MSRRVTYYNSSYASFQYDVDALEFISNWETNTEVTMETTQRLAVDELYKGLKGLNTVNGTDFLTDAKSRGAIILPLVPLDNSNANALAYELDMVSNGVYKSNLVGYVSDDITPLGLQGASTKRVNTGKTAADYSSSDVMIGVYNRTSGNINLDDYGVSDGNVSSSLALRGRIYNGLTIYRQIVNNTVYTTTTEGTGLITHQRISSSQVQPIENNIIIQTSNAAFQGIPTQTVWFNRRNGSSALGTNRQYCLFYYGLKHLATQEEVDDWYELWQRFQTNIITGGRAV
jgi:hypothetical protein